MFIVVSVYGWVRWARLDGDGSNRRIEPTWAGWRARVGLIAVMIGGTAVLTPVFQALGSSAPVWPDAWVFVGSLLATYGMAKGWVEFWLIWVAVDVVGVPPLLSAHYYASAAMYVFYSAFTLTGFFVWWRERARASDASAPRTARHPTRRSPRAPAEGALTSRTARGPPRIRGPFVPPFPLFPPVCISRSTRCGRRPAGSVCPRRRAIVRLA